MQVLPKDTGWDTLTAALMKLYDAEIRNKQINLHQLNVQTELARQLGDKDMLEKLTGRSINIANPLLEKQPDTALDVMMQSGINPEALPKSLSDIQAMKGTPAMGPSQEVSTLANMPQAIQAQGQFDQWQDTPRRSKKYIEHEYAGEALNQIVGNFHQSVKGMTNPADIEAAYNKSRSALVETGEIYRRKDAGALLGSLKMYLPMAGSGAKVKAYRAVLPAGEDFKDLVFSSANPAGEKQFFVDFKRASAAQGYPDINPDTILKWEELGTNTSPMIKMKEKGMMYGALNESINSILGDENLTKQERISNLKEIGRKNRINITIDARSAFNPKSWTIFGGQELTGSAVYGPGTGKVILSKDSESILSERKKQESTSGLSDKDRANMDKLRAEEARRNRKK